MGFKNQSTNSNGDRIRAGFRRIEAALTKAAVEQPQRKALGIARRISERGRDWERQEIARAEAAAARLRAARRPAGTEVAQNVPDGTKGRETA